MKNNFIIDYIDYTDYVVMEGYVDIQKWKIVIIDYVDYPVLYKTVTYRGIFSRNFSVVLHASFATKSFLNKKTPIVNGYHY